MNLTLKDIPDTLHRRLREEAETSGRSLNKLILHTLERTFCARKSDRSLLLERIRQRRNLMKARIDDFSLEAAIEEGRS